MRKNLIILGLFTSILFTGTAFACDMPEMRDPSKPCPVKDNKTTKKESVSSKKVKQPQPKTITKHAEHKH